MKKILAIDDQQDNLTTIKAVLKSNMSECILLTALSGKEGIEIAQKELPDAILLDIIMPKMDGFEVCKKLKEDNLTKHIPIIMVTAIKIDSESRVKGLNIGADAFLSKPIDPIELTAQINVMLRIKKAEDCIRKEKKDLELLIDERTIELSVKNKNLEFEIKKRKKAEIALRNIATEFSAITGLEFLEKVCLHLTKTLNIDYAFISEYLGETKKVLVKAGIGKGMPLDQFEYKLEDTPCENVIGKRICSYTSNIQELFPKDQLLIDMGIESYLGIPLFTRAGQPMGIMVLLDSKELTDLEICTSLLKIFSDRVATEMERMKAKTALQESEIRFRGLVELLPEAIFETNLNFDLSYVNKRGLNLFGYTEEDLLKGLNGLEIIAPEYHEIVKENFKNLFKGEDPGILEYMAMRKDGSVLPILFHASSVFKDGELSGVRGVIIDLSEHKLTEKKIRKLSTAVEQSPSVIVITDVNGKSEYVNPKYSSLTGYSYNEALEKDTSLLKSGEQSKEFYKKLWDKISSGKEWRGEFYNKKKNGEFFWEAASVSPIFDEYGKITNYLKVAEDITEKRIAEKKLKESETRFKALHNASFGGIAIHDLGIIKECNQGLSTISGYTNEELIGMNGLLLIAKNLRETVMDKIKTSYEKPYEVLGLRKNGDEYPLRLEGKTIPYKGKDIRVVEFRDITEQKNSELALLDSERKHRTLVDNLPVGIFRSTYEGQVISANPAMAKIYGYNTIKELLNIKASDFYAKKNPRSQMLSELEKNGFLLERETLENKRDGSNIWVSTNYKAIFNEKNKIDFIDGVIIDISERKEAHEKISQKNKEINAQNIEFKKINIKLKKAKLKAEESDRLKSAFLATMSHELRTPLNAIIGFSDIITKDLSMEEVISFNSTINSSGKHLLNIVEDLFDITLIETGEIKIIKEDFSLIKLLDEVDDVITIEQKKLQKEHLSLKRVLTSDYFNTILKTDSSKLKQIVINLLKNALKFTTIGEIQYGCVFEELNKQKMLKFFVKDTGIGVPIEKQEFIFDMFRQVDDTHTRIHGGTGIGLSISKKLVELLGGEIWMESTIGKGSTFFFTVPYKNTTIKSKSSSKTVKIKDVEDFLPAKDTQPTILVVEDIESSYEFLKVILNKAGYKTNWIKNGKLAIDACKNNPEIKLVLMDINMPVMNGYEATKAIKKIKPNLPIIAQTAYAIVGDREKVFKAGFDDYISKPIKRELLISMIKNYIK